MASKTVPYYAEVEALPSRLPTLEEIWTATDVLSDQPARRVVGLGEHFVVKYGGGVDVLEGETMLFLQQATSVPIPRVYAVFRNKEETYIIMERVKGELLDTLWSGMDQTSKQAVATRLRHILTQMRTQQSPGQYCGVGAKGLPDGIFWTDNPGNPFAGPFDTESNLNDSMVAKYLACGMSKSKAEFYRRAFRHVFKNHEAVFTHGDLQRKNIILRSQTDVDDKQGTIRERPDLVLIDWEYAGWYPSYWEYSRAVFACGRWTDDWSLWLDQVLEPALSEFAWLQMFLRELWS